MAPPRHCFTVSPAAALSAALVWNRGELERCLAGLMGLDAAGGQRV